MSGKNKNVVDIKNKQISSKEIVLLVEKKLVFFYEIIQKTILHVQKNKNKNILELSDVNNCLISLNELNSKLKEIKDLITNEEKIINTDLLINKLQTINNELSIIFKNYGTESLEDFLSICFGNAVYTTNDTMIDKLLLLKKYFHPVSYKIINLNKNPNDNNDTNIVVNILENEEEKEKIINKKITRSNKQTNDETLLENAENLDCFDILTNEKSFYMKVYGISIFFNMPSQKKTILVMGFVEDIINHFLDNKFINNKISQLGENLPINEEYHNECFKKFIKTVTLKDYLVLDYKNIYGKYAGYLNQINLIKQRSISQNIKDFTSIDLFTKRQMLIYLLVISNNYDNLYLAYLLYDLLSNDINGTVDSHEQILLHDSLPWAIKEYFRDAMKKTIEYTNDLSNFDINKIPLEQQICLLKVPDSVKEKAMMKLKEVKAKSEDSGSKARQYLDGLLKIPFGVYRKEPILNIMDDVRLDFKILFEKYKIDLLIPDILKREKYTSIEIIKNINKISNYIKSKKNNDINDLEKIMLYLLNGDKKKICNNVLIINDILKKENINSEFIKYNNLTKERIKENIVKLLEKYKNNNIILNKLKECFLKFCKNNDNSTNELDTINNDIVNIKNKICKVNNYIDEIKNTLDKAIHGHERAKKQVERIVGQWINGEQKGVVLGFEGPPGLGKTSLAKVGISNILKDEEGNPRPFSMIQLGGDSNGSSLHGHNFTYVGSTWGSIVQILIDKKCLNPIILIDEVDKISKTEHGKEIVGILTHLLDPTQNDCFQDKYFSGIDLDLSKALFILSYNDVDLIDRILLDRIHRIKFDSLSLEDKLIIANKYVLPEIYKTYGLEEIIEFPDDVLKFIIDEYTMESGVRKMKQILNEIVGDINLDILKEKNIIEKELPIIITIDDIKYKYFKDKHEKRIPKIHNKNTLGIINALWANSMGQGGVLPLQVKMFPCNKFLELKLTGSLGDVMKESINVSLTNAWNLTNEERKKYLLEKYNNIETQEIYGLHLHCSDLSTPKDGPSATAAFTVVIYSILNDIKIKNTFGITGETSFDYKITAIGGLDAKILGSIPSGIKEYIYPVENQKDFDNFYEKYKNNKILDGIKFHPVNDIYEVFDLILEK